jgi:1-acyl-sn-glycerol-3-phosphate acyltransferase
MPFIRSVLHMLFLAITVIPWALFVLLVAPFAGPSRIYRLCARWLKLAVDSGTFILGIQNRVTGLENLPTGEKDSVVLLVKHQSTWETLLMPAIMPRPLAFVFKKELLWVPFFGWAMACMDMIHIDRSQGSQAFKKMVASGKRLTSQGTWVILFPEGTRIPRGQTGEYKTGGTRLAIKTPGIVDISIGKPISSEGRRPDELMAEVQAWIEAEVRRLDPEAYR